MNLILEAIVIWIVCRILDKTFNVIYNLILKHPVLQLIKKDPLSWILPFMYLFSPFLIMGYVIIRIVRTSPLWR